MAQPQPHFRRARFAVLFLAAAGLGTIPAFAQQQDDLEEIKRQMQELMRVNAQQQKQIEKLEKQVETLSAQPAAPAKATPSVAAATAPTPLAPEEAEIEKALSEVRPPTDVVQPAAPSRVATQPSLLAYRVGGAELRLIDVSFDIVTAVGSSTVGGQDLRDLQGGAHDPNRRGFTLQQGELSLAGAVDPYFIGEAHVVFTDSSVELEEAFFVTTSLPYDLQLRGGYFFTDFGRINPFHPHAWTYEDQPVIITRMFGGEGLRTPGLEANWLAPLPWFSLLTASMQDGDETDLTVSFLNSEGGIGGRPAVTADVHNLSDFVYLARWANSYDFTPEITGLIGLSFLYGANSTGADASTFIYGTDLTFKWRPSQNFRGWPFVVWQTEAIKRDYRAESFIAGTELGGEEEPTGEDPFPNNLPGAILRDYGFYSYLLYGFAYQWAAGMRVEYATGSGKSVMDGMLVSRETDPFRGDRLRVSPLLIYQPSEFSRIRLQYNYDNAKFLPGNDNASSVWLGFELLYGTHPAHKY